MEEVKFSPRKITKPEGVVMVVYAFDGRALPLNGPWIYGVYKDCAEGFAKMEEMQESKEYGHLIWSNNIIKVKENLDEVSI